MAVQINQAMIIGAGIGGLCTAIGLRQMGIEAAVYEQAVTFGEVGAGLTLWANAIKGLRRLGIAEEALGGARVCRSAALDWKGRVLSALPLDELEEELGAPTLAVHRADVHRALLAMLPEGVIHTNKSCTGFVQDAAGVTARFADGSAAHGDLLVGADGIHSTVRRAMVPAEGPPRWNGNVLWRATSRAKPFLSG
ncbi:MAG: hypothetical protein EHM39_08570, partial [Chloroflexi bacterium]